MAVLDIRGLAKGFPGDVTALAGIDLSVDAGRCTVLLGPSGCGKTTLLRCIAGLEAPDAGTIRCDGRDLRSVEPQDRPVGLVFQDFALYPHKRVRDNIGLALRVRGMPKPAIAERIRETAALLRIDDLLDRFPRELSGGQKQRVGIGRAIARRPRVLLMDEPLSNLDAKLRHELRDELAQLRSELVDTAIVYVTHDQSEATSLGDDLVLLDRGKAVQTGTGRQLYADPVNRFVAEFIGSPPLSLLPVGERTLGLRPEAVRLAPSGADVSLGHATLMSIAHNGHEVIARYRTSYGDVRARLPGDQAPPSRTPIGFASHQALWFGPDGTRCEPSTDPVAALLLRSPADRLDAPTPTFPRR